MGLVSTGELAVDANADFEVVIVPDGRNLMGVLVETDGLLRLSGWVFGNQIPTIRRGVVPRGFALNSNAAGVNATDGTRVAGSVFLSFAPIPLMQNCVVDKLRVREAAAAARLLTIYALYTDGIGAFTPDQIEKALRGAADRARRS